MKLMSIQMLRGLAALGVVAFHAAAIGSGMVGAPQSAVGLPVIENLYSGVDLFFLISGFIMVFVTGERSHGPATAGAFLASRMVRIYPVWWLFAAIFTAIMFVLHVVINTDGLGWGALSGTEGPASYLLNSFALLPQEAYPVLALGWTLIHEVYFYAVFALSLLVSRRWLLPFLGTWGALVIAGALAGLSGPLATDFLSLAVHPLTLEFLLGALIALAVKSGRRWRPGLSALLGAASLLAVLIFLLPPMDTPGEATGLVGPLQAHGHQVFIAGSGNWGSFILEWGRVVFFAAPAGLLIYGLAGLEVEGRIPTPRPLVALGDWSYSLYLCHIIVLLVLARAIPFAFALAESRLGLSPSVGAALGLTTPGALTFPTFFLIGAGASILVAALTFNLFERPLMRRFMRARGTYSGKAGVGLGPAALATRIW